MSYYQVVMVYPTFLSAIEQINESKYLNITIYMHIITYIQLSIL